MYGCEYALASACFVVFLEPLTADVGTGVCEKNEPVVVVTVCHVKRPLPPKFNVDTLSRGIGLRKKNELSGYHGTLLLPTLLLRVKGGHHRIVTLKAWRLVFVRRHRSKILLACIFRPGRF